MSQQPTKKAAIIGAFFRITDILCIIAGGAIAHAMMQRMSVIRKNAPILASFLGGF